MSDIMERLLQPCSSNDANRQRKEAAAEIERLQALLKEYEEHAESYWTAKVERLRVERDELLAALKMLFERPHGNVSAEITARAVIAKAEGK